MATYYIDYNRGNDSNNGTSTTTPWKNLSKLPNQTLNSGDSVLLARDSIWNITAPTSLFASPVGGSVQNPVYFGAYSTALETLAKPQINLTYTIAAGSWTYDAPNNGWYTTFTYDIGVLSLVLLGSHLGQVQATALPMVSRELAWKNSSTRVYVYAPSTINPTDYYGSVLIGPCYRSGIFLSDVGTNILVENLEARYAAAPFGAYFSTGGHILNINNITMVGCAAMQFQSNKAGSGYNSVIADNLHITKSPSAGITFIDSGSGTNVFSKVRVTNSTFKDGNLSYGSAAIYLQCHNALIENNYVTRMKYGAPSQSADGCGIYADISCYGAVIRNNIVTESSCAFQSGSVGLVTFDSNLVIDCGAAFKFANELAVIPTEVRCYNNTAINCLTRYPTGASEAQPNGAIWTYDAGVKLLCQNNIFTATPGSTGPCFSEFTSGFYSGSVIDNNVSFGFSTLTGISYNEGGAVPLTPTNVITTTPDLDNNFIPKATSTIKTSGTFLGYSRDFLNNQRNNPPSLGAFDYKVSRGEAVTRGSR